jgi:folate-binding protein YgfZ
MYFRSPLYELQKASGSVFQSYDHLSYELPSHFGSAEKEYAALNGSCVIIDFSYYGYLKIIGKQALDFLNRMSTNDLKKMDENKCAATVLTNDKGRIIDLISVSRMADGLYMTTSPQCDQKIIQWLDKYIIMDDVQIRNLSAQMIHLGLIGPRSAEILKLLFGTEPPEHDQVAAFIFGGQPVLVSQSFQLDNGFILTANVSIKQELWELFNSHKIPLCGMEAYFAARIEQKKPIMGTELSEKYNPLEAGLQNSVSFTKGCYIGQEVIARLDSYNKIQKHLVQLKSSEPFPEGAKIFSDDNKEIGMVTSSTHSYKYGQNIALGYVKTEFINTKLVWISTASEKRVQAEFCS